MLRQPLFVLAISLTTILVGCGGDVPPNVEFGVNSSGGSLAGLKIGLPNQASPEGDKEPPCQGNQRSQ